MDRRRLANMTEATRLVQEGRLGQAAALLQGGAIHLGEPNQPEEPPIQLPRARPFVYRAGDLLANLRGATHFADLLARFPSGKGQTPERHTPREPGPPLPGRWLRGSYANAAGAREYRLYVPSCYIRQRLPMIVMLHGGTQTAEDFAVGTRMNELAERHQLLVVYPEQSLTVNPRRYWSWFQPTDQQRGDGEPSLVAGLTSQLIEEYSVDPGRVYVAGFSAGAAMAAVMAACYPDMYAAVGVHSGLPYGAAHDVASALRLMKQGKPVGKLLDAGCVPLIVFHGDDDAIVDHMNAQCLVDAKLRAAGRQPSEYRRLMTTDQVPDGRRYTHTVFTHIEGIPYVELWTIQGGGHAWSGGSPRGSYTDPLGPDASAELLRFFKHHSIVSSDSERHAA